MDTLRLLTRGSGIKLNNKIQQKPHALPSAGRSDNEDDKISSESRKRKREIYENKTLSQVEIREFQNRHKIRMTDLLALHEAGTSASRKIQKESSRIFPQPLQSFSQLEHLAIGQKLTSNISEQGYREPTEVQSATIPVLLQTKLEEPNLLTIAPTGSGKTLAFLIPLINHIIKSRVNSETDMVIRHVSAIILAPTKELVMQIVNEGRKLTVGTGVRITAFRKGMRIHDKLPPTDGETLHEDSSQEEEASSSSATVKADILVSTPLSLVNAAGSSNDSEPVQLPHIRHLILDEADVLLDPLFREQTLSVWSTCSNPLLRISLWSATIGSNIEELAIKTITARQKTLQIRHPPPLLRTIVGLKDTSLPTISHKLVYASTESGKLMGLRQLLHPPPSTAKSKPDNLSVLRPPFLVFTQTIDRANALHHELLYDIPNPSNASLDIPRIAVLHSSLTTPERSTIMTNFRLGKIWILITTDLLSRGVDFRGVNGVVNYDIPTTAASYIHRAGRTGRAGREGGICITFYTKDDVKYLKVIANVIAASEKATGTTTAATQDGNTESATVGGVPSWLLQALPNLTKADRKDLKTRGVDVRRGLKESDTAQERKMKGKNRIGTASGYERREENRKRGAIEGSKRRKREEREQQQLGNGEEDDQEFGGFD